MTFLPKRYRDFRKRYPRIAAASDGLAESVAAAGPLNEKTRALIKLGIAIGAGLEGGVHSHARRARACGATAQEIRQAALLAISTVGFPPAMAALSWVDDILARK
jgi:4-carboxymuconolactone decarboxylase